jgi:signal transduction histidine kinase
VALAAEREGDVAVVTVADAGPGIPVADQARIFDAFQQGDGSVRGAGGLGLGLFISRRIVEAHGGTISLRSAPGEGAAFRIELPVLATPRAAGHGADGAARTASPLVAPQS